MSAMPRRPKPPAVLIVNPSAGKLPPATRDDVTAALGERFDIEAVVTTARGAGTPIAARAASEGVPLVIAFGGDGHVNEVANGLAGTASPLAVIPGGTMNVFARSIGIPADPFAAIDHVATRADRPARPVNLGRMGDRYFTFCAGCGFDAEAAEQVERYIPSKRRFGQAFFYWSAFRVLTGSYRHRNAVMRLKGSFGEVSVAMSVACNTGPYAYLAGIPIRLTPDVALERGLDVFALTSMRMEMLPLYAWRAVVSRDLVHHRDAFYAHDLSAFQVTAPEPFSRHVDGEPLAPAPEAHFSLARDALLVKP